MAAKDLYEKDYYQILGVAGNADAAAIKKQYRKLARELHPDKTKGDKKLEDRFKAVSEAYDILSDRKSVASMTMHGKHLSQAEFHQDLMVAVKVLMAGISVIYLGQVEISFQHYLAAPGKDMALIYKQKHQSHLKIQFMELS